MQTAAQVELIESLNKILVLHLSKGVTDLVFEPNQKLKVGKGETMVENPQITITPDFLNVAVRQIVAVNQDRGIDTIEERDILQVVGGNLEYDVLIPGESGMEAKTFRCLITLNETNQLGLKMGLEPEIRLGFASVVNPAEMSHEQVINWLDDFGTRIMNLNNPKAKDVLFHPNKRHPYITVTGGLRPIKDILIAPTGKPVHKIAQALIKVAENPSIDHVIAENKGLLDTLDLDLSFRTKAGRRFRVNIADVFDWEVEHAPLITMRLLPERPFTMEELKLPEGIRDMIYNLKMGLVLICGTTGSGKSTTMCAMIDFLLKSKSINFLTVENPVETIFPSLNYPKSIITQRDVGKHAFTQPKAMESAVRQSLNMAMVGEIRNAHDAMMAMELAQSGHLIFATIHAGSVGESVRRVVDMFPADQEKKVREMLAAQYKMGLAQVLVKGVLGQTELVLEIMKTSADVKALITETQDPERRFSMREILEMYNPTMGTLSLDQCLVNHFKAGRINEDIMMYNSPDPDALVYRQNKLGVKLSSKWDPTGADIEESMNIMDTQIAEDQKVIPKWKQKMQEVDLSGLG
jgi:twitching motility protein PilT